MYSNGFTQGGDFYFKGDFIRRPKNVAIHFKNLPFGERWERTIKLNLKRALKRV